MILYNDIDALVSFKNMFIWSIQRQNLFRLSVAIII
jgi:hypothetical protein